MTKNCLTLIGMPASGKSSVGVVLAKRQVAVLLTATF